MRTRTKILCIMSVLAFAGCSGRSNSPPVASAGSDQTSNVLAGDAVVLDGSASSDPDSDTLTYSWSLTTVPPDSTAAFNDSSSDKPEFVADKAGTYVAQLVVNDGKTDSAPADVTIVVAVPPPTATIATPAPLTLFTANPATVSGTVDDPLAAITVNGTATPNNNGSYSADVTLAEGSNTVTVVATNGTGEGNASVDVILKTLPGPAMSITSPRSGFTAGVVWDGVGASPSNNIPVQVAGTVTTDHGPPTVMVNNVSATISTFVQNPLVVQFCKLFPNAAICKTDNSRYSFAATIQLVKGPQTITVDGFDTVGGSTELKVNGVADYCLTENAEPGVAAERGNNQSNRCHEVDGCSLYVFPNGPLVTLDLRNDPMPLAQFNAIPIQFGSGTVPPSEFFVHGQSPTEALGCNIHDTCYQTCVPNAADRTDARTACNVQQLGNHSAVCRQAYGATCPYTVTGLLGNTFADPIKCPLWLNEKLKCYWWAAFYFDGVTALGKSAYDDRQGQYCRAP